MKLAIFAYSRQGCKTARKLAAHFSGHELRAFTMARFEEADFEEIRKPFRPFYGELFSDVDAMIFVGSVGIAVREIAPHVRDKRTDPAVVSVDELGRFSVALLSGHIGGANDLAKEVAGVLGATPVITTATDINHRFSVDAWAARQGFAIGSMSRAKAVSAAILEGDVPLKSELPIVGALPDGVVAGECGELGIYLGVHLAEPFGKTLRLIPPIVHMGIGCRRGTTKEEIAQAVQAVLSAHQIDPKAVAQVASIDLKQEEQGLLEFCRSRNLPIRFYSAGELRAVAGEFSASEFVQSVTGVDNVCERAALHSAQRLIVKKQACNGVTVALAIQDLEVSF